MNKFDFDYLLKRSVIINEMAPKSKFWNSNFPEFMNFYLKVQAKMKEHPKAPSGTSLSHKRIEYISRMLFNFLSKNELSAIGIDKSKGFEQSYKDLAIRKLSQREKVGRKTREYTPEYAQFAGNWADTSFKQQDFMLSLMVGAYEDKALSEKFVNKVMDESNIDAYFNDNLFKDFSSNFASGMKSRKEGLINTGKEESEKMDLGDFYEIQNNAKRIIQKLRQSKKLPKGLRTSIYHADIGNVKEKSAKFDKELYPLFVLQTTLEQFLELKEEIDQDIKNGMKITPEEGRLYKFNTPILLKMLDFVNKRINQKNPLDLKEVYSIIEKMTGISDQVREEYDGLYEDLKDDLTDALKDRYDTVFDMLDDDLLNSLEQEGVINSDDRETLKKWASISGNLQKNIQTRGEKIIIKNIERGEKEKNAEAAKKKYEDQGKKWEAEKQSRKKTKIDEEDDDGDKLSNSEDEEGIMGYMTEQVYRDRFSDNRGKFVDRGFKKPKNYAHWLWLNQQ